MEALLIVNNCFVDELRYLSGLIGVIGILDWGRYLEGRSKKKLIRGALIFVVGSMGTLLFQDILFQRYCS